MRSTVILVLSASLLPAAVSAQAIEPSAPSAPTADEAGPSPEPAAAFRPFMVHLNLGLNTYTYLGAFTGLAGEVVPEAHLWPGNRLMLLQQLGFGWWVHPNVRLTITLQFAETATNLPSGSSPLTLMGAIPWVTFTHGPFFAGAGPLLAWWAYGAAGLAAGIFLATGFTVPVGSGWGLGAAVQAPLLWGQRFSFGITPALVVAHRF